MPLEAFLFRIKEMDCVTQELKAKIFHCGEEAVLGFSVLFFCFVSSIILFYSHIRAFRQMFLDLLVIQYAFRI